MWDSVAKMLVLLPGPRQAPVPNGWTPSSPPKPPPIRDDALVGNVVDGLGAPAPGVIVLVVPEDDLVLRVETRADVIGRGRAESVVEELLFARPGDLHGLAGELSQAGRLDDLSARVLAAEAAADEGRADADVGDVETQGLGDLLLGPEGRLRRGPDFGLVPVDAHDGRVRLGRGVGDILGEIGSLDRFGRKLGALVEASRLDDDVGPRRDLLQVGENIAVVELRRGWVELGFDEGDSLGRDVRFLVENGDEVAVADDPNARDLLGRGGVGALELGAMGGGPDDRGVKHAGDSDVARELGLAGDFCAGVGSQGWLARDRVRGDGLDRRLLFEADFDLLAADEVGVSHFPRRRGEDEDRAVLRGQRIFGRPEPGRGQANEDAARFGRGLAQSRPEILDAPRPERAGVIGAEGRIAHDHVDRGERHVELLGQHHLERREGALAHLDLAGETGHAVIGADLEVGVGVVGITLAALSALLTVQAVADRENDEETSAGELEELATLEGSLVAMAVGPGHRVFVVLDAGLDLNGLHGPSPSSSWPGRPAGRPR